MKSFLGVQGAIFQKSPMVAEGINSSVTRHQQAMYFLEGDLH